MVDPDRQCGSIAQFVLLLFFVFCQGIGKDAIQFGKLKSCEGSRCLAPVSQEHDVVVVLQKLQRY
jgi:hypothetical protein